MEGKARSGAQQPAIVLQSYIWPDAQGRRLHWNSDIRTFAFESVCEASLWKRDLPMLGKFDLGSKALMVVDRLFEKSRVWSKMVEFRRGDCFRPKVDATISVR